MADAELTVDGLITPPLEVQGCHPGKMVQTLKQKLGADTEAEVGGLRLKSSEIFFRQPILLKLEAPLKFCGDIMNSIPIYCNYLNMEVPTRSQRSFLRIL